MSRMLAIYVAVGMLFSGLAHGYHLRKCPADSKSDYSFSELAVGVLFYPVAIVTVATAGEQDYFVCPEHH